MAAERPSPLIRPASIRTGPRPGEKRLNRLKRFEDEWQVAFGEAYVPGIPDSHGDFMTPDTVREMAYRFLASGRGRALDIQHDHDTAQDMAVVESFIASKDDTLYIPESWVVGVYCPDPIWQRVKAGELNGFSIQVSARGQEQFLDLYIPDYIEGMTHEAERHKHAFVVHFNSEGQFEKGMTLPDRSGHTHKISAGTATDRVEGHSHRYSFIEQLQALQNEAVRGAA